MTSTSTLWARLRSRYERLISLGVSPNTPLLEKRRIELANRVCLWLLSVGCILGTVYMAIGPLFFGMTILALSGGLLLPVAFNSAGKHTASRFALILFVNSVTAGLAWLTGAGNIVSPMFVAWLCLPFVLFPITDRKRVWTGLVLTTTAWILAQFASEPPIISIPTDTHIMVMRQSIIGAAAAAAALVVIQMGFTCASLDLTFRSANLFRSMIDDGSDAVLIVHSPTCHIRDASEKACKILGIPRDELLGTKISELGTFLDTKFERKAILDFMGNLGPQSFTGSYVRPDSTEVPIEISIHRLSRRTESLLAVTLRDLSSEVLLKSAHKLAAIGEMAGSIAHEINTPLATVVLSTETVMRELNSPTPDLELSRRLLQNTLKVTERISRIIRTLRSLAKDGSREPFRSAILSEVLDDVISLCQDRLKSESVELQISRQLPPDFTFACRPTEVAQVILNLLNNSIDAVSGRSERWIRISAYLDGDWVSIGVSDAGDGVPEALRPRIFDPFFTTKETGKGTGIGLPLSRTMIEGHGGSLTLESNTPNTTFTIRIPATQAVPSTITLKAS